MAVTVQNYIAKLLSAYEDATGERHSKIAGDMDIPVSNYYLYRSGMGNPTGKTINKIVAVIQMNRPEVLIETIEWYLRQLELERDSNRDLAASAGEGSFVFI